MNISTSNSRKTDFGLNLFKIVEDYFERLLEEVNGMKCLVLDRETTNIISLICSQSQILKKNIYFIETIEKPTKEKLLHLNAIYFIRPTEENILKLIAEIKDRRFNEYNIFFSNTISNLDLEKLAVEDEKNVIKKVIEVYSDFYVLNQELYSLNILNSSGFRKIKSEWNAFDEALFERMISGVVSVCFALRKIPIIRYQLKSSLSEVLASKIYDRFQTEVAESSNAFTQSKSVLLILERKEDPVTPLLNQWTYQKAMLHELIGIKNNRIEPPKDRNSDSKDEPGFVISPNVDHFFEEHMFEDFGDFAESVKKELDEYANAKNKTGKIETLDDMQKVLDSMPELKKKSANISKHVGLTSDLSQLVQDRKLIDISKLEQDMSSKESKNEHLKSLLDILNHDYNNFDKLKLAILFSLRYEKDEPSIVLIKKKLLEKGLKQDMVDLIDYVLKYSGMTERVGDLFATRDIVNKLTKKMKQAFKDVPNVFTQHEPYICSLIDNILKGKLRDNEYGSKPSSKASERITEMKPNEIIIFIIGGATYEEAKFVSELNKKGANIILGGTNIINSKLFLGEIKEYEEQSQKVSIDMNKFENSSPSQKKGYGQLPEN